MKKSASLFLILVVFIQLMGGVFVFFVVSPPKQAKAAAGFTPTEFVTTVNTDGGGDYLTLSAWESAIDANLTASTTKVFSGTRNNTVSDGTILYLYRGAIYQSVSATTTHLTATQGMFTQASSTFDYTSGDVWCDSDSACNTQYFTISDSGGSVIAVVNASGATEDTTAVTLGGWTKSASNYIDIRGDNTTGKWNTNAYRLHPSNSTCIANTDTGGTTKISNLQLYVDSSTSVARGGFGAGSPTATSKFYISNSIFRLDLTANLSQAHFGISVADSDAQIYAKNNVFYDFKVTAGNAVAIKSSSNYNVYAYNNTIFNCDIGLSSGGTNFRAKNNIINNCTADTSGLFNAASTNNLTDIAPGATNATGTVADSGITDAAATNKLKDSDQNFLTTVKVNMIIKNTTDNTYTYVTAVDSDGILSVNDDIFANTEAYTIYTNRYGTPLFESETSGSENLHLQSTDTAAIGNWSNVYADASLPVTTDVDGNDRPNDTTGDIGADEYVASASLTFVVKSASTEALPNLTPGTLVSTTSILEVNTTNSSGFYMSVQSDDTDTTMDDTADATNNISDKTEWWAPSATTSVGNATASTTEPQTLQFRVRMAGTDTPNYASSWWGSDDTTTNALFAGFPSTTQKIINRSTSASASTTIYVLYNLDVPVTQKTGTYSGSITYTATANP